MPSWFPLPTADSRPRPREWHGLAGHQNRTKAVLPPGPTPLEAHPPQTPKRSTSVLRSPAPCIAARSTVECPDLRRSGHYDQGLACSAHLHLDTNSDRGSYVQYCVDLVSAGLPHDHRALSHIQLRAMATDAQTHDGAGWVDADVGDCCGYRSECEAVVSGRSGRGAVGTARTFW